MRSARLLDEYDWASTTATGSRETRSAGTLADPPFTALSVDIAELHQPRLRYYCSDHVQQRCTVPDAGIQTRSRQTQRVHTRRVQTRCVQTKRVGSQSLPLWGRRRPPHQKYRQINCLSQRQVRGYNEGGLVQFPATDNLMFNEPLKHDDIRPTPDQKKASSASSHRRQQLHR